MQTHNCIVSEKTIEREGLQIDEKCGSNKWKKCESLSNIRVFTCLPLRDVNNATMVSW